MKTFLVVLGLLACQAWAKPSSEDKKSDKVPADKTTQLLHPCAMTQCDDGYECDLDKAGEAECICQRKCPPVETDVPVCTTRNETFPSECEFHRERCICRHEEGGCKNQEHVSALIDYFGKCRELPPCEDEEMAEFPHRMRKWLYLVMEELDERGDLTEAAHDLLVEAKAQSHPWVLPVIWKFCDLDTSSDRFVTTDELFPISAPLKPLEHCTAPFLERCDKDDNGKIDMPEWGACLELDQDEIEDRCDALRN